MATRGWFQYVWLAAALCLCACSPGESVASIDLMRPGTQPTVELSATDTVRASIDLDLTLTRDLGMGAKAAARACEAIKAHSTLSLKLVAADDQVAATATCDLTGPGWSVHNSSARRAGGVVSYRGTVTTCAVRPPEAGRYRVEAEVVWAESSDLTPTLARVDVRRVR